MQPIAHIRTEFSEKFGIPRQSGRVPSAYGKIVFLPQYRNPEALKGIEMYDYLWLIFDFSEFHAEKWSPTVRPPRLGGNRRVGVFATRSPNRPNPIGLSSVKLEKIVSTASEGVILWVSGVDLLDMTPIYDIKPYLPYTDSHPEAKEGFASEHKADFLDVFVSDEVFKEVPPHIKQAVLDCLREDPRPAYQDDPARIYHFCYGEFEIDFTVSGKTARILSVHKK